MKKPGSKGEHNLQKEFQTEKRALAFYQNQLLNHLNPEMCRFIMGQEFVRKWRVRCLIPRRPCRFRGSSGRKNPYLSRIPGQRNSGEHGEHLRKPAYRNGFY